MKKHLIIALGLSLTALPFTGLAQSSSSTGNSSPMASSSPGSASTGQNNMSVTMNSDMTSASGPQAGDHEFTLSGSGSSNNRLNNSTGALDLSLGYYLNDSFEMSLRQSAGYDNPPGSSATSEFSTLLAFDQHFLSGDFRPFIGVNLGGVYGKAVQNSFEAGLEAGVKYYVKPKTFVFGLVDYSFLFRDSNQIQNRFDHGAFFWNAGIGFLF